MQILDFHTHYVPRWIPPAPPGHAEPAWPSMEPISDTTSRMMIGGRQFRVFDSVYWDADSRLDRMNAIGVGMQVITPLPELLSYWMAPDAAEHLTTHVNQGIAALSKCKPEKMIGFGCVVLQDPMRAARQLATFPSQLNLRGVLVGARVHGRSIADPAFYPVLGVAEELGLAVFVHGIKPGDTSVMLGPALMPNLIGVPHENALAIASFMFTDILQKFPRLKLVFAHGGGTIGSLIDRLDALWKSVESVRKSMNIPPSEYARKFHYDTAVFSAEYLGFLVNRLGADRFLVGTDGPVDVGQPRPAQLISDAGIGGPAADRMGHQNALTILGT